MVTGANLTPHMVPEFLTGRPMQCRETLQRQTSNADEPLDHTPQFQEPASQTTPLDPTNRLAEVLVGMNNHSVSTNTDGTPSQHDYTDVRWQIGEIRTFRRSLSHNDKMQQKNHFRSLLRKNALQTFRNINTANRQTLEDILAVFRRKYVKPESQATAKHKWHSLMFDPNTMKLLDFHEELNQRAEKAFGENAQAMIDSLLYAKLPPKLKRSVKMATLENATYEEIVTHLERELELNELGGRSKEGDDNPVPTLSTAPTAPRPGTSLLFSGIDPNITCNYCKKPGHIKGESRKLKRKEEQRCNDGQDNKKEIQNVQLATKRNTRRNDVGKALEPTSSPKTLNWRTPPLPTRPPAKKTQK